MSYTDAEQATLDFLRTYPTVTFDTTNSSRGDWKVLDRTGVDTSAILEQAGNSLYGDEVGIRGVQGAVQEQHDVGIWICQKRKQSKDGGDGKIYTAMLDVVEGLIAYFAQYERIQSPDPNLQRVQVIRAETPVFIAPTNDASQSTHRAQRLIVRVWMQFFPDIQEYSH